MKVTFIAEINESKLNSYDSKLIKREDYLQRFTFEWGSNPLPIKGDLIDFNNYILNKYPEGDNWSTAFYERTFIVNFLSWRACIDGISFEVSVFLDDDGK